MRLSPLTMCFRAATLCVGLSLAFAASLPAADPPVARRATTLEERLQAGLRTRLPEEKSFVETVAALVRSGRLPAKLVDSTYQWAIDRNTKHPFPAFQKALRMQAARLGVTL